MTFKEERFSRSLPCRFTVDELRVKADELADKVARCEAMEDEKKSVAQDYKHRVDALAGEISLLARHISQKQEHRQIECIAIFDSPTYGEKAVWRTDSGELVGHERMSAPDRQLALQFGREPVPADANPLATAETAVLTEEPTAPETTSDEEPAAQDEAGEEVQPEQPKTLLDELEPK